MRFKNGSSILQFLRYTTKTTHDIFLSWAYGGKKGIRTLEGFRGPTRFPVVRLRPAQPSFHIFSCAAPDCMSYYNNLRGKCQALFCGFLKVFRGCGRHGQIVCKLCAQTAYFARFILLQTAAYSAKTIRASSRSAYRQRALCGHAGENYHAVRREDISCIPFFAIWRSLS